MRIRLNLAALALAVVCPAQATVTSAYAPSTYSCNGSTTAYTISFKYLAQGDLLATSTTAAGVVTTLALTTDYTVSPTLGGATGTLTLVAGSRCPSGSTLKIARSMALTQPTGFRAQGPYSATSHETAYDRDVLMLQQVQAGQIASFTGDISAGTVIPSSGTTALTLAALFANPSPNVLAWGAKCDGSTDDSAAFAAAKAAHKLIAIPEGTCSLGATGFSFASGTVLAGIGQGASILTYSGTGAALTGDGVAFAAGHFKLQTSSNNAGVRGILVKATSVNVQRVVIDDVYLLNNSGTSRAAGQVALLVDGSATGVYWSRFVGIFGNLWDTTVQVAGNGANQGNSNHFEVISAAANKPFYISRGNDNYVEVRCTTSDGTLVAGTQVCLTVGDGAVISAGNEAHVFSDQGATGQGVALAAVSQNNVVWSVNESTNADTDAGTSNLLFSTKTISGLNQSFSVPSFRNVGAFANAGTLLSSAAIQLSKRRAIADIDASASTGDYVIAYTSISATRKITLPSAASQGLQYIIKDESGSAAAGVKIQLVAAGGQSVNGTASPGTVDCVASAYGSCNVYADGATHWFTY